MLGKDHALSGVAVGLAVAGQLGDHTVTAALPFVVTVAGYALGPDLDCGSSTASRFLGPVSEALSWFLQRLSAVAFHATATSHDHESEGTHRHATHTLAFALVAGGLAQVTSQWSPWVVAGWIAFGVLAASAALGEGLLAVFGLAMLVPIVFDDASPVAELAGMQQWIGLAVTLGCVVHLAGDAITVTGVPLFWPIRLGGQAWHECHLLPRGLRLHTGLRIEHWVVHPTLVAACVAVLPLVSPGVGAAFHQFLTAATHA